MAFVYEARRESLAGVAPRVAIKLILPDYAGSDTFKELFINEARLGAAMQHQNLVQIQDFDAAGDQYFLVMEYVEGITFAKMIRTAKRQNIPIPMSMVAEVGRQACDGLHHAHMAAGPDGRELHLVHRDIKPSNLILSTQGVVKVLDFGISKGVFRPEKVGSVKGTWGYMAPEQAVGKSVGPTADIFGLGVVLWELAARKPMFRSKDQARIRQWLAEDHALAQVETLAPEYEALAVVLRRALQNDPKHRYQTAAHLGQDLAELIVDSVQVREQLGVVYDSLSGDSPPAEPEELSQPPAPASVQLSVTEVADRSAVAFTLAGSVVAVLSSIVLLMVVLQVAGRGDVEDPTLRPGPPVVIEEAAAVLPAPEPVAPMPPPRVPTAAPASPEPAPPPVEPSSTAPPVAPDTPGNLAIGCVQAAEVYIDGALVRGAGQGVDYPPGQHVITLITDDGRRKSLMIDLEPGQRVQRSWDFDRMSWR